MQQQKGPCTIVYCNPNILFLIWMDGKSQLVWPTEGWFSLAEATSCLCFLFPLQREPFGDRNPGRDAESTSPGEKSCLRLQKAYLQQAVLVTFIKIEHWAFLLLCFFVLLAGGCYCKALTPLCSAVQWKFSCPRPWRRQEWETVGQKTCLFFSETSAFFIEFLVTDFSQPLILKCTPSNSIRGSLVLGEHICHNLLDMAHSRCWRRGQKINKLDWAARSIGRAPYAGLRGSDSAPLHLFTAIWAIRLNFIKRSQQKRKIYKIKIHNMKLLIAQTLHLPSRQICNDI